MNKNDLREAIGEMDEKYIAEAALYKSSSEKRLWIISAVTAAACLAMAVLSVAALRGFGYRDNGLTPVASASEGLPILRTGRYYYNGDVSTGAYIEVTEETIVMGGDGLYDFWLNERLDKTPSPGEEGFDEALSETIRRFTFVSQYNYYSLPYSIGKYGTEDEGYFILYDDETGIVDKDRRGGWVYLYDGKEIIAPVRDRDFYFVEPTEYENQKNGEP